MARRRRLAEIRSSEPTVRQAGTIYTREESG
jgi:hypothetical protein